MRHFGFESFAVVGHDRGARCGYRMALDHPERVQKLAVLDIVPTFEAFHRTNMAFGLGYWHWFFLAQPYPLPEGMIGADPDAYYFRNRDLFDPEALADYLRCVHNPATIHAMCEDYRAGGIVRLRPGRAGSGQPENRLPCPGALGPARLPRPELRRPGDLARLGRRRPGTINRLRPLPGGRGATGDLRRTAAFLAE